MRLFGKVNSQIDRYDRAQWLTGPFDGVFAQQLTPLAEHVISGYFGLHLASAAMAGHNGLRFASAAEAGYGGLQFAQAVRAGKDDLLHLASAVKAGHQNAREP